MTSSNNFYEALQARLLVTLGGGDLITLEQVGVRRLQQIFGRNVVVQPGLGVAGLILIEQANLILNPERFQQIASTAYTLFRRDTNRFHTVVSSGNIRSDLARATDSLLSGSFTAHVVASSASNEHAVLSAFLDLGRSLIEGPGRRLLAALLASTTRHAYEKLRNWNSTRLLDNVKVDRFGELFIELDNAFRDASAHQDFYIDGPHIVLHEEHPERLSVDVMVNRLLGHIEVVMGIYLALLVAASDIGKDLTDSRGLRILGLNGPDAARFMLSLWGWQVDSIELDDELFSVHAVVGRSTPLVTAITAASTAGAFDDHQKLEFHIRSESSQHLITGPTDVLLRVHREALDRATWNVAIFGALWRIDGRPLIEKELVRAVMATHLQSATEAGFPECVPPIRAVRAVAAQIGDQEVDRLACAMLAVARCGASSLPVSDELSVCIDTVDNWAASVRLVSKSRMRNLLIDSLD
ncbi:MAG: hypothetical protein LC776_08995, partial [Acidobacteria bacterium]|nr:hypothetical protein [Acidobacteriota bacterium]